MKYAQFTMSRLMFSFPCPKISHPAAVAVIVLFAASSAPQVALGENPTANARNPRQTPKEIDLDGSRADGLRSVQNQIRAARAEIARSNIALAQQQLQSALEVAKSAKSQAALSLVYRDLAYSERLLCHRSAASNYSHRAVVAAQAAYGSDSLYLLPLLEEAMLDCRATNEFARLPDLLEQTVILQSKCGATADSAQLLNLDHLSKLYQSTNKHKEATEVHWRILKLTKQMYGPQSQKYLTQFATLAQLMFNDKDYSAAESVCQAWIDSVQPQDSAEFAKANFYMGLACHNQKKIESAQQHFLIAWVGSTGAEQKATSGIWLIQIESSSKNYDNARKLARQVYKLCKTAHLTSLGALALEEEAAIEKAIGNTKAFESLLLQAMAARKGSCQWSLAKDDLKRLSTYFNNIDQPAKASDYAAQAASMPN